MNNLKFTKTESGTIVKIGRKKFAEITFNKNPDYNFCVWQNRLCFSGYETESKAIEKVQSLYETEQLFIKHLKEQFQTLPHH